MDASRFDAIPLHNPEDPVKTLMSGQGEDNRSGSPPREQMAESRYDVDPADDTSDGDGTVEYRQTGKLLPAFKVNLADVTGFSVRKGTRQDKKNGASAFQQMLIVQGSGTELAACRSTTELRRRSKRGSGRIRLFVAPNEFAQAKANCWADRQRVLSSAALVA